jgi:DNA-binding GntR family transcriptional regulator
MLDDIEPQETLTRPALAVELADRLRRMIVDGDLEPGGKVPEKALTERFGVSRTPLREALKVLAAEGYIRLIPNRGSVVTELTIEALEEAFPITAALEGAAGELACRSASDEEIAHAAFEAGDMPYYFDLNQQIHGAILAAARNPMLLSHHRKVAQYVQRARYQVNRAPQRWAEAVVEHDAIVEALEARDGERLGRLMKEHLDHKLQALRRALAE